MKKVEPVFGRIFFNLFRIKYKYIDKKGASSLRLLLNKILLAILLIKHNKQVCYFHGPHHQRNWD